ESSLASGVRSVAQGYDAEATEVDAQAFGSSSSASGVSSQARGTKAIASGTNSIADGTDAGSYATDGIAMGTGAQAGVASPLPEEAYRNTSSIAIGDNALADHRKALAVGSSALASAESAIAIGTKAMASTPRSVALGDHSTTEAAVGTASAEIDGKTYVFAGQNPVGTVSVGTSVGTADEQRTITHVAAGRISADSTDAINGSQLYNTNQALESLADDLDTAAGSVVDVLGG